MLRGYLWGIFLCTSIGIIYGWLKYRNHKKNEPLGWPVAKLHGAWTYIPWYSGVGALIGILWPGLIIFISVTFIYNRVIRAD